MASALDMCSVAATAAALVRSIGAAPAPEYTECITAWFAVTTAEEQRTQLAPIGGGCNGACKRPRSVGAEQKASMCRQPHDRVQTSDPRVRL